MKKTPKTPKREQKRKRGKREGKKEESGKQQKACGKEFEISNNPPMCLPIK